MQVLLKNGANTELKTETTSYPIRMAAGWGHSLAAKILLAHGADPLVRDDDGNTMAEAARNIGYDETATLLERAAELQRLKNDVLKGDHSPKPADLRDAISKWRAKNGASYEYVLVKHNKKYYLGQKPSGRSREMLVATPKPAILPVPLKRTRPGQRVRQLIRTLESDEEEYEILPSPPRM